MTIAVFGSINMDLVVRTPRLPTAGDAFNGALAMALRDGYALDEAIRWGLAAGALSVTSAGAQPPMPDRDFVAALLAQGR